jgi:bacillithiol biosynthesis cysteine-adding enzyme BshC
VLTGQQAGIFGGPLYTVLKAVTAIQIATDLRRDGIQAVPVFWVDADDHDWAEVCSATVLDAAFNVATVRAPDVPLAGAAPVSALTFDGMDATLAALRQHLAPTEFTEQTFAELQRCYAAGAGVATAFACWMHTLFAEHGLVVFDASDPDAKRLVGDLFARELQEPQRTSRLVGEAGAVMARLGHQPQIQPQEDSASLFYLGDGVRRPIRLRDDQAVIGDVSRALADLAAEASAHPERFSPNVVLRPLVQDRLFPTVCYVGGPSELAYHAQLGPVYAAHAVERPLLYARASATLLDAAALRFLERSTIPFEALQMQDESVLNAQLREALPVSIESALQETTAHVTAQAAELRSAACAIDPTLGGAVDTTVDRIRDTLQTLQHKIVQASKKKDETTRRQFMRTRALAFPGGVPQERQLNVMFFINRYGLGLISRLIESLPREQDKHYLMIV